jgi:hypothetical protein
MALGGTPFDYTAVLPPRPEYVSIEDALQLVWSGDSGPDMDLAMVIQRLALNFSLMMTHAGVRVRGPVRPHAFRKHQKLARGTNRRSARKAERFLSSMPFVVEFEQEVRFFEDRTHAVSDGTGEDSTGRLVRPHWRRGHWRNQRHGPGRSFTKLVFIRPMLVNKNFMLGDASKTRTTYVSQRSRKPERTDNGKKNDEREGVQ